MSGMRRMAKYNNNMPLNQRGWNLTTVNKKHEQQQQLLHNALSLCLRSQHSVFFVSAFAFVWLPKSNARYPTDVMDIPHLRCT